VSPSSSVERDDPLTPAALERRLRAAVFGHRIVHYPTLGSTNDRALELAAAGESEGTLVLSEEQTGGRGRRDRTWLSPAGAGIYASLILRPGVPAAKAPLFTFMAAVSVAGALREAAGVDARIKWPNDILARRRKIAGILGEVRGAEPEIREMVVGLGVNVHQERGEFPPEIRDRATSVRAETGGRPERAVLLAAVLEGFEARYRRLLGEGPGALLREWQSLSAVPAGGRVMVEGPAGRAEGAMAGVDDEGALLLSGPGGRPRRVPFGEIVRCDWG
jgi:BirA family biotin operon repressor/biotin-[acetyl-CoA-carboxylase] ligase